MHICLAIYSMRPGGAEKVMSLMANYWVARGHKVTLLTISNDTPFYKVDSKVIRISLDKAKKSEGALRGLINNIIRLVYLGKTMRKVKPDVMISFTTSVNILSILACIFMKIPVIVSERYNPYKFTPSWVWRNARKFVYPLANYIVVQSKKAEEYFFSFCNQDKIRIIYNPVDQEIAQSESPGTREKIILNVGRLKYVKGQDMLIKAFALSGIKNWELHIVGEGEERSRLTDLIAKYGLEDKVFLPGTSSTIIDYYNKAGIFVLSSRAEGFPNCLLEAMSCGLPVISFDCQTGPSELIRNRENGILVPANDVHGLKEALRELTMSSIIRKNLGEAAEITSGRFNIEPVMIQWETLILECIN